MNMPYKFTQSTNGSFRYLENITNPCMKRIEMYNKMRFMYYELRRTPTHGFLLSKMQRKKHDLGCTS